MAYIGQAPTQAAFVTDTFSGNGSTTAFTMSVAPANTSSVLIAVSGVLQDPSTYSVSGLTLTFSAAPPTGTGNISARYLGIPASGVTTTAYRTVTEFTATANQRTFTPPSYTVGFINVYRNGILLGSADYTATNGTTVVLTTGATSGDLVTVESFLVSSVLNAIPNIAGGISTSNLTNASVTPTKLSQPFTSGTAVASTSGTSIDFTGIPSWVKRITVMYKGVSTNGTNPIIIQLGTGGTPTYTVTGYLGTCSSTGGSAVSSSNMSTGYTVKNTQAASSIFHGNTTINLLDLATNTWSANGTVGQSNDTTSYSCGGSIALAAALTAIRITSVGNTNTFSAGLINILYE